MTYLLLGFSHGSTRLVEFVELDIGIKDSKQAFHNNFCVWLVKLKKKGRKGKKLRHIKAKDFVYTEFYTLSQSFTHLKLLHGSMTTDLSRYKNASSPNS